MWKDIVTPSTQAHNALVPPNTEPNVDDALQKTSLVVFLTLAYFVGVVS